MKYTRVHEVTKYTPVQWYTRVHEVYASPASHMSHGIHASRGSHASRGNHTSRESHAMKSEEDALKLRNEYEQAALSERIWVMPK